ncbi:hypothetical protein P280DRAFT_165326 [Massarina eburnea CBS 473.64]|uniref:Uncharacterized protein n=1 Tax=Massarina eburnea CBS 473.64 TaxID=1395130 RepID=A0A6A6RKZ5_9PLEO|nr:hypothetical protein P280DRAFT_165326 [Massarina eburnea CBS 473.64]
MESTRSSSRSRRSYPNLHNLSLAPLSSKYPLDGSAPPSPSDEDRILTPRTSYIAQKSAPTTPGILSLSQSRSNSRNGRRNNRGYAYDGYFLNPDHPVRDHGEIPKAKSTNSMLPAVSFADQPHTARHHTRKGTAPLPLRKPLHRHHTSETTNEWFHRAGIAIAGETRDSKGQGWLVRRESSTSLVDQTGDYDEQANARHMALLSGEHLADVEYNSPFTPRMSRPGSHVQSRVQSRMGSRMQSARQSRRGSVAGSRADLIMSARSNTPSARHSLEIDESMFEDHVEPDFVEADEDGDDDEEEVARLARERGFGLGNWMDRLIGWTLFDVDEDAEESEESEDDEEQDTFKPENMTKEELKLCREVEARRRKLEREAIIAASAVHAHDKPSTPPSDEAGPSEPKPPPDGEGGGWADAAWLFSVASKVIL